MQSLEFQEMVGCGPFRRVPVGVLFRGGVGVQRVMRWLLLVVETPVKSYMAVVQNLRYLFGGDYQPKTVGFKGFKGGVDQARGVKKSTTATHQAERLPGEREG